MGGQHGFSGDFGASMSDIFDDLFGEFMGGGRRGRGGQGQNRGADLRYNMEITLEEAFHGKSAEIEVPASVTCEECEGSGAEPDTSPTTCQMCHGHGKVRSSQGFFSIERTCPTCHGRGEVIADPCNPCGGTGCVTGERTLSVNIPVGIEEGTRIRLSGERRGGLAWRADGRSLHLPVDQAA